MKKHLILPFVLSAMTVTSFAQGPKPRQEPLMDNRVVPWPYLREADVMWSKRIWRVIDTRQKQNQPMMWPRNPLNTILYNAVLNGTLIPYKNDSLTSSYNMEQYINYFAQRKPVKILINPNGDPYDPSNVRYDTIDVRLRAEDVKKFKIMEDWIFDKKESRMYVRIIAIAPIVSPEVEGVEVGEQDWGWFKYYNNAPDSAGRTDIRHLLVNNVLFNRQNDVPYLSYDDWFEQRLFSGYIVKESNAYDLYINQFAEFRDNGVAALLESERIHNELMERESDLWEH